MAAWSALWAGVRRLIATAAARGASAVPAPTVPPMFELVAPIDAARYPASSGWGEDRAATPLNHGAHKHEGLDFPAPVGEPVRAMAAGVVVRSERSDGVEGEWISLRHLFGCTHYFHLDRRLVAIGDHVMPSQVIGRVGRTGVVHSGPHVHVQAPVKPSALAAYVARHGEPDGGFGRLRGDLRCVPLEPLLPYAISDALRARALARGLRFTPGLGPAVAGAFVGLLIAGVLA